MAGNIDVMNFLLSINCPLDPHAMITAAEGGHLEALKFLAEVSFPWLIIL
jgi:hypothetical protein